MTDELRFWRDVEIFNIPDAPTAKKPGRPGSAATPDEIGAASTADDVADEATPDALAQAGSGDASRRSSVVQRFPLSLGRAELPETALPWNDPRFKLLETNGSDDAASTSAPMDELTQAPASYAHAIYLGVGRKQRFVDFILRTHAITPTVDELYRPASGHGWLAAFIAGGSGIPLPKTYVAASFAVGSSLLQQERSLDEVSGMLQQCSFGFDEAMDKRCRNLRSAAPDASLALTWDDLVDAWEQVHQPLGGIVALDRDGCLGPDIVIESVPLYRRNDDTLSPAPEQAATFLNSFYIDDLTTLIRGGPETFSAPLAHFLGPDSAPAGRLDLLDGSGTLARHAGAALIPAGRWVAAPNEHLALAQQAAVYQILDGIGQPDGDKSRGLMAVNGPPGTGKTTLLKDLVADIVVQRAKRLCALPEPSALFTDKRIKMALDSGQGDPLAVRADVVAGTEIVVTSNNNAAVQNISFELPFACDRAAFPNAAYFPEVAAFVADKFGLARKDPWGLLAATLGAKANREKIATALMGYEKAVDAAQPDTHPQAGMLSSLKPWLDLARKRHYAGKGAGATQRWHAAKADFSRRLADVESARASLVLLDEAIHELPAVAALRDTARTELTLQRHLAAAAAAAEKTRQAATLAQDKQDHANLESADQRIGTQQTEQAKLFDRLRDIRELHNPGWLSRALKKILGVETAAYRYWKAALVQARGAADAVSEALMDSQTARDGIAAQRLHRARQATQNERDYVATKQALEDSIAATIKSLDELADRETALRNRLAAPAQSHPAPYVPDTAFLALAPQDQHRASLWLTEQLERKRAELFLSALGLHEATILATASEWFKLLRVVRDFLGARAQPATREDHAALWHALFFVIPVVSTSLASFGRQFGGLEGASLGWVLIDEAGQATPASVAGALWRAQRAVLVGDPLQIEPVVTVPRKLVELLGRNRGMNEAAVTRWSPSVQSAQVIADRTMRLGAQVGEIWTGMPLRTHRRCMAPMFEISNQIAYDNQMVQATRPRRVEPDLSASCWIDVGGEAVDKIVPDQIESLRRILSSFMADWPQVIDGDGKRAPASVYVISPFRDVALECINVVGPDSPLGRRFRKNERRVEAGTVHTFQGKEASIVFLVLGSAPGDAGAGSRGWAAAKPNLLNVALTRAQQRFYVVGNYADWAALPFFSALAQPAGRLPRMCIAWDDNSAHLRLVPAPVLAQ